MMSKIKFSKIKEIVQDARRGKMFILLDDEGRENEGDLIIPASKSTAKSINFMAKYGRGLICLALNQTQVNKLNLSLMSPLNKSRTQTAFTVSIDAKKGVSTGISAHDRALTIKTAIKKNVSQKDIVSPGHVFPLISKILKDGFQIVVIPQTLKLTNLMYLKEKNVVNIEFDVLGKYIKKFLK